jgi:dethiobiotin synthetase
MSRILFVTGTDTEVGKTWCSVRLVEGLVRTGRHVSVMKPVACGTEPTAEGPRNGDALALQAAANVPSPYELVNPYCLALPASPHLAAAAEGVTIEVDHLVCCATKLAQQADLLVVEGAGGWLAPISDGGTMADIAVALAAQVIVVVGLRLGCLSHALLTVAAVQASGLGLAGWIANHIDPQFPQAAANVATLERRIAAPLLGVVPYGKPGDVRAAASPFDAGVCARLCVAGKFGAR